ncbi:MAG: serine protease, partial [Alteraurantiacibacter sp.]
MHRFLALLALLLSFAPNTALADPADIEAASRGVVRVVIVGRDGEEMFPVSHGTGFAVGRERIVTNAHVVQQAVDDERLAIGIVPADGDRAVFARIVSVSRQNDLALLATTENLGLPPLSIAGNPVQSGAVTAIGYPLNVDRAQGLSIADFFRAQPPVTATGFLSGRRPSRDFDTLLHTAPIAAGNSGGPLVDECGRVLGVNSFGAESAGSDAEFFFAVSTRELLPFLRANDVAPRINSGECRSIEELDAEARQRRAAA